jgi:3'-phosphoadenosine 5'-phosphosulfate sulfotransferase (PAPS reductase)/FAD synthetase
MEVPHLIQIAGMNPHKQISLFEASQPPRSIAITPLIAEMIASDCVVAIGVSGGKDSQACALQTIHYLDQIGHAGPRVLIHADLKKIEWLDSLPTCERLAAHLNLELIVVRRQAGGMIERWQKRWENNVERYRNLSCVRLILPFSTPKMRFCTSDLKLSPIASALKKRFPKHAIVNVSGIRRQESSNRSKMPVSAVDARLNRKKNPGCTWNSIIDWTLEDVLAEITASGLELHEAYTRYGASRVSCSFCIMSAAGDLIAASTCEDNHGAYVDIVELEAVSSFAFQGSHWLGDVAPHLLSSELRARVEKAKEAAALRREIEAELPSHLLFVKGWPAAMPTHSEASLIASVRSRVSRLVGIDAGYLTADTVLARYSALIEERNLKSSSNLSAA